MKSKLTSLEVGVYSELLLMKGVSKFSPNRRHAVIFSADSPADSIFFVESGLVKLFTRGEDSKESIIDVVGSGSIFGEQSFQPTGNRGLAAEVLQAGTIHVVPRDLFVRFFNERPALWRQIAEILLHQQDRLAKKIELLCLRDVEYRILYCLNELASRIGVRLNNKEYSVALTQGEFASFIGAARETTSTALNALARRGRIRLGRRQIVLEVTADATSTQAHLARAAGN
jgi:CRP-like cAMP-binding protein